MSNRGQSQPAHQAEHNPDSGDLNSIGSAVDWLCHGLDRKLDTLTTAQHSHGPLNLHLFCGPNPFPAELLGAEYCLSLFDQLPQSNLSREHNYHTRLPSSLAQDGGFVLMPLRVSLVPSFPHTLGELHKML